MVNPTLQAALPPWRRAGFYCRGDWVGSSTIWTGGETLANGIRSPARPACWESLYQMLIHRILKITRSSRSAKSINTYRYYVVAHLTVTALTHNELNWCHPCCFWHNTKHRSHQKTFYFLSVNPGFFTSWCKILCRLEHTERFTCTYTWEIKSSNKFRFHLHKCKNMCVISPLDVWKTL